MTDERSVPDYADDTSYAWDEGDHPRFDDGPASLPGEEPLGVDEFGVTAEEERHGEPLAARLVREEPDIDPDDPQTPADPDIADEAIDEASSAQAAYDADALSDGGVSLDEPTVREIGRLVAPDEGAHEDTERDAIAYDSGEMGDRSAEEAAMHEIPDREPYDR